MYKKNIALVRPSLAPFRHQDWGAQVHFSAPALYVMFSLHVDASYPLCLRGELVRRKFTSLISGYQSSPPY